MQVLIHFACKNLCQVSEREFKFKARPRIRELNKISDKANVVYQSTDAIKDVDNLIDITSSCKKINGSSFSTTCVCVLLYYKLIHTPYQPTTFFNK